MPELLSTSKRCSICGQPEMRRLNRNGFWERRVLSFFGYYPWECVICRKKRYRKGAGQRRAAVGTR
jgi:hypothetical protein